MDIIWNNFLQPILSSPTTTTIVAIIAATGAYVIYSRRRRDYKRDAANIILLELKNAEKNLDEARKSYEEGQSATEPYIQFPEKLRLMNTESWTKYKYLFVRDLEPEQWDKIGAFYDNCRNFDEAVEHKDSTFRMNETEIRASIHRNIGAYAKQLADGTKANPDGDEKIDEENQALKQEIIEKSANATNLNMSELVYLYNPNKSFGDASYYFNLIPQNITDTQTGLKLKRLAGVTKKSLKNILS